MENVYQGRFNNWNDVVENFFDTGYADEQKKKNALEVCPEPDRVFIAAYGGGGYDGDALVVFRRGEKYYTVEGGHCSCYGLEDQWKPEEYDYETFVAVLDRKIESNSRDSEYPSMDKTTWELVKTRLTTPQAKDE